MRTAKRTHVLLGHAKFHVNRCAFASDLHRYVMKQEAQLMFHDYVRSLANAPSPTPVQSRGILFQYTSEKRWTFIILKDFSRLTLLFYHIMFIRPSQSRFYVFIDFYLF